MCTSASISSRAATPSIAMHCLHILNHTEPVVSRICQVSERWCCSGCVWKSPWICNYRFYPTPICQILPVAHLFQAETIFVEASQVDLFISSHLVVCVRLTLHSERFTYMFSLHIYIVVILCIIWIRTNCTQWEIYICLHARPTQRLVRLWLHLWIVSLNVLQGVIGLALSLSDSLSNHYETTQPECSIVCSWSEYLLQIYPILSFF